MKKALLFLSFTLLIASAFSCKKEEGTGGQASICGKVYSYNINKDFQKTDSGYFADARVFIAYGDKPTVASEVRSSYDGSFCFDWLQKGNYTVWVVGECDSCAAGQIIDSVHINIREKRQQVFTRDLITWY